MGIKRINHTARLKWPEVNIKVSEDVNGSVLIKTVNRSMILESNQNSARKTIVYKHLWTTDLKFCIVLYNVSVKCFCHLCALKALSPYGLDLIYIYIYIWLMLILSASMEAGRP